ncbi:PREDICTED: uncharacterized protein LOC109156537 [Ipomoea nil]|uniref:uncharacterized protein LOC109156537 n=1 Tax=Ipomoea nil TaxID=35883 RepID=UPI000901D737|nr:PREDICTED: uncharacterized protein LOC109156537 [Ipomoea nil]
MGFRSAWKLGFSGIGRWPKRCYLSKDTSAERAKSVRICRVWSEARNFESSSEHGDGGWLCHFPGHQGNLGLIDYQFNKTVEHIVRKKYRQKEKKVQPEMSLHSVYQLTIGYLKLLPCLNCLQFFLYRGLKESEVDGFVEDVFVSGKPWASRQQGSLHGAYVFVCAHNKRDRRCGVCGPALIEKFKEEIEAKGLEEQVSVAACSHIGGHKYPGNVIIFSEVEGKVAGHWYGYVTPNDVPTLLDQHIGEGKVIERIWRGQMGLHAEKAADKTDEQKVPNGTNVDNKENKPRETRTEESKDSFTSCCQGANGISCCRDASAEEVESKKAQGGPLKFGKWEQRDILTAVGVVAAVSVVAVAYGFYKRAR